MLAPTPILRDPPSLLADVRSLLSLWPELACCPWRLAESLEAEEHEVRAALEALYIEGWLCP